MIFLHTHKGCVKIGFGVAFTCSEDYLTFVVFLYSFQVFVNTVIIPLYLCFAFSLTVDKLNTSSVTLMYLPLSHKTFIFYPPVFCLTFCVQTEQEVHELNKIRGFGQKNKALQINLQLNQIV